MVDFRVHVSDLSVLGEGKVSNFAKPFSCRLYESVDGLLIVVGLEEQAKALLGAEVNTKAFGLYRPEEHYAGLSIHLYTNPGQSILDIVNVIHTVMNRKFLDIGIDH